jgi:hypothetical protein
MWPPSASASAKGTKLPSIHSPSFSTRSQTASYALRPELVVSSFTTTLRWVRQPPMPSASLSRLMMNYALMPVVE